MALGTRTLISLLFHGNPQFSNFHAALVWLLQLLCGGITQSNLTTASREDRIIIYLLPRSLVEASKPIVSEQGRLVESSDDML